MQTINLHCFNSGGELLQCTFRETIEFQERLSVTINSVCALNENGPIGSFAWIRGLHLVELFEEDRKVWPC